MVISTHIREIKKTLAAYNPLNLHVVATNQSCPLQKIQFRTFVLPIKQIYEDRLAKCYLKTQQVF